MFVRIFDAIVNWLVGPAIPAIIGEEPVTDIGDIW